MSRMLVALVTCVLVAAANANPAPLPVPAGKDLRSIGGGLLVSHDAVPEADSAGNITVLVFSRSLMKVDEPYALDLSELAGMSPNDQLYDAGAFGLVRAQSVTLDCVHRTYEVVDPRKLIPEPIWRPASTLPALAPVFRFACGSSSSRSSGVRPVATAPTAAGNQPPRNERRLKPPANVDPGPSFDCSAAQSVVERLICADSELAGLDRDFSQLYTQARAQAPDIEAFRRSNYRAWQQKQICVNKPCLVLWYSDRRRQLMRLIEQNGPQHGTQSPAPSSQTTVSPKP
jgi:hypothetical protein